jgi:hypothetical protein
VCGNYAGTWRCGDTERERVERDYRESVLARKGWWPMEPERQEIPL